MRIVKTIAAISVLLWVILLSAFLYISRDIGPSHPALAGSDLPPLIPVGDFFADSTAQWGYQPSFDGSMLAWYAVEWGGRVIRVRTVNDPRSELTLRVPKTEFFNWHPYRKELLIGAEGRLWQVDPEKPRREDWSDVTPRGFKSWRIVSLPHGPADRVVVISNDRNPAFYDLYTVRQDGGGKTLLEKNDGRTINWWLGESGNALLKAERLDDDGARYLIRNAPDDAWRLLTKSAWGDVFEILNAPAKGEAIFALSDRGRDRVALVRIDAVSGAEEIVADHPRVDAQMPVSLSRRAGRWDLLTFHDGFPEVRTVTPRGESFAKLVLDGDNPVDFDLLGASLDGRFVTVARSWRERSFEYFLYDLEKGEAIRIGNYSFRRHRDSLAETVPVRFNARDGLEISGLLMLPKGVTPRELPTIVMIHGGPAQQEYWGYNQEFQFLANRGYAVLAINYRGSTGFGKAFREAGYGEVGKAMQDDIVDGARWLIAQGIADEANIAVMGSSYGGYSAALAMTRDSGLFKAAIVEHGLMNIAYQMQNNPFSWGLRLEEIERYFGDPQDPSQLAEMHDRSPLAHVKNVSGAVLITAGKGDRTVGFEQSEEFERALRAAGKNVKAVYFEKEGHGYRRWQTKVQRARLIEDFLAEQLGGRSGGFDYAELAAKYLN